MIVQLCQQEFPPEFGRNTAQFRGVGLMEHPFIAACGAQYQAECYARTR